MNVEPINFAEDANTFVSYVLTYAGSTVRATTFFKEVLLYVANWSV